MDTNQLLALQSKQEIDDLILGLSYRRRGKSLFMEKTRIFPPEQTSSGVIWGVCVGLKDSVESGRATHEYNYLFRAISKRMEVIDKDGIPLSLSEIRAISDRYDFINPAVVMNAIPVKAERKNRKIAKGNEADYSPTEIPSDESNVIIPSADDLIEDSHRNVEFGVSLGESQRSA